MTRFISTSSSLLMMFSMLATATASVASMSSSSSIEKFEDTLFSATMKEGFDQTNFELQDIELVSVEDEEDENGVTLDGTAFLQRLRGLNENNNQNQQQNNQNQQQNNQNQNQNQNNNNKYYNGNYNNNAANYNKNYNYANNNANQNADWLHDYQLKFQSCHELSQYNSRTGSFDKQMMIKFKVCPRDTCDRRIWFRKCRGGATYAADARDFIGAYLESKLTTEQRTCKYQQSICQYKCRQQNGNGGYYYDDNCTQNCMANGNYNYCLNGYGYNQNGGGNNGQNNKNNPLFMENYMECTQLQKVKNSSTGYPYYGKAHCGLGGHGIYFSLYTDQYCSIRADSTLSMYDFRQQYGVSLPFVEKSMVSRNDCVSCRENYNNNGHADYYDHKDQNDVAHSCSALYNRSLKCENKRFFRRLTNFGRSTYNTEGCRFINRSLPAMDDVNRGSRRSVFMNVLAWILGLAVCYLCVISCMMGKKSSKARRLAEQDYHNSEENFSNKERERQREWEKQQRALERDNHHFDDARSVNTSSTKRSKSPFKYFKKGSKHDSDDHSTSRHSGVFS